MINLTDSEGKPSATFSRPQGWTGSMAGDTSSFGYGSLSNGKGSDGQSFHPLGQQFRGLPTPGSHIDPAATTDYVANNTSDTSKREVDESGPTSTAPTSPPEGVAANDHYPVGLGHPPAQPGLTDTEALRAMTKGFNRGFGLDDSVDGGQDG